MDSNEYALKELVNLKLIYPKVWVQIRHQLQSLHERLD